MGFQTQVYDQPNPAVEGDFASTNPRDVVLAGPEGIKAGASGVVVGRFAWYDASTGLASNAGANTPAGFVHREQQALITAFLAEFTMTIPAGLPVVLHRKADVWVKTLTVATVGQKVFVSNTDGTVKTGAAGATVAGYTELPNGFVDTAASANGLIKIHFVL